jgi:leucyl-tRNA synthetase
VAAMMEFVNAFEESVQVQSSKFKVQSLSTENAKRFLQILAPFAPFITEEIWHSVFGEKKSIHLSKWPDVNKEPIDEEEIIIPVQVNGKLRSTISIKYQELSIKNRVEKLAIKDEKVKKYLEGKKYQVIYIPNKILNFVTK